MKPHFRYPPIHRSNKGVNLFIYIINTMKEIKKVVTKKFKPLTNSDGWQKVPVKNPVTNFIKRSLGKPHIVPGSTRVKSTLDQKKKPQVKGVSITKKFKPTYGGKKGYEPKIFGVGFGP